MKTLFSLFLISLAACAQSQTVSFTLTLTTEQATELTNTVAFVNATRLATYSTATNSLASENARLIAANPLAATNAYPPYPTPFTEQQYINVRTAGLLAVSPGERRKARADDVHSTVDALPEEKLRQVKAYLNTIR